MELSFHAPAIEYSVVQSERMSFPLIVALFVKNLNEGR